MAYSIKYRFDFDSVQGSPFRIDILKDGYSGPVLRRAIGGTPVLRRDRSDNVCGTSLEFPAECLVDNEFEEFKTSVPFTFKVNLMGGSSRSTLIWTGFVTPELMSAPDIAPPYDVTVSCTDGLGELKYAEYTGNPSVPSLRAQLEKVLDKSGLDLPIMHVNDLVNNSLTAGSMLDGTYVSLDHLKGESCYDVLQYILVSLHADITQYNGSWLIFKETGLTISTGSSPAVTSAFLDGVASSIPVLPYGSMSDHQSGWWPVGHMSHSNIPPKRRVVLTSDNHYAPDILAGIPWVAVGSGVDSGDYWTFAAAGDGAKKSIDFLGQISQKLLLSIKVRNVGSGSATGKMSVVIKATGQNYTGSGTFYLTNAEGRRRMPASDFRWDSQAAACSIEVQAPETTDTDADYVEVGIVIPAYRNSQRDYFYLSALEITVSNEDGTYGQRVYGATLSKYEQFPGFRKTVDINNGARGEAPDVELGFATITGGNNYGGVQELMYAVPMDTSFEKITTWSSSAFSSLDYLSLMARDYALSIGMARTSERGRLNVPVGHTSIPVVFRDDYDNSIYIIDTFSWSLYDDELEVEMQSLPASSLTVEDEAVEEGQSTNGTGHQQAQASSSGGGGGGGSTVAISNLLSTGTRIATVTINGVANDVKASVVSLSDLRTSGVLVGRITIDGVQKSLLAPQYSLVSVRNLLSSGTRIATIQVDLTAYDLYVPNDVYGSIVSISNLLSAGTRVATITIDGVAKDIKVPVGSIVAISNLLATGDTIAILTIDGVSYTLKAPPQQQGGDQTIDVSIGGTAAAPTVAAALSGGSSDSAALPVADKTHAGIVSTAAQVFGGNKTFDRIYLGNSEARGAYIEWDDTAQAFKIVGDIYATGDVAAGE